VFETADADLAGKWMTAAYGTSIRMSGLARGTVLRSRRTMLGDVAFDHSELPKVWGTDCEPGRGNASDLEAGRDDQRGSGHPCSPVAAPWSSRPFGRIATISRRGSSAHRGRTREDGVNEIKQWTVTVDLDEHDGHTRAVARLLVRDTDRLTGVGLARLDPADRDIPEIGDEIAAARALSDLSHRLLQAAIEDVEQATGTPAQLRM
jgi:hypothetical protein